MTNNYSGYPYQQQPQQPMQQPQQPMQQPVYQGQQAPQAPQAPYPPTVALPVIHMPNEEFLLAEYQRVRTEAANWGSSGGTLPFLKFLGPQGQAKWDESVPSGYESRVVVAICPPWAAGKMLFKQVRSHFWKSQANPQGKSLSCPGPERCLVCQSKEMVLGMSDSALVERAKSFGRVRKQYLYNVIMLENLQGHYDSENHVWRPFILGAGAKLHGAIGDLIQERGGALNIVDPQRGRPVRLKKRKVGKTQMDVEYSAVDLDPSPLPQQFWPILHNMHDLDKQERLPTHEDMASAVRDMGLPVPGVGQSYQAVPSPAYPNPYQTAQPSAVGAAGAPTYLPPPADPMEFPPGISGTDPAYSSMMTQQPPMTPPPMTPPPVQSQGGMQGGYSPQPGQMMAPPPPPVAPPNVERQPVAGPPNEMQPQTLAFPLPPGVMLPGGRERCFSKFNEQDRMCQDCPSWVRQQCQPISGIQPVQQDPQTLGQLQTKLSNG